MTLDQCCIGQTVTIDRLAFDDDQYDRRIQAMGLRSGSKLYIIRIGLGGSPLHVRVGTTELAIRKDQAKHIIVVI